MCRTPRIAGRIAHLAKQRLVEAAQDMNFLGGIEVDAINQVNDIAQKIAALHAVRESLKYGGDHVAPLALPVVAAKAAKIGEKTGTIRVPSARSTSSPERNAMRSGPVMPPDAAAQSRQR